RTAGALHRDRILDVALVADVGVEAVVFGARHDHIFEVRPAAEDLYSIVRAVVDLNMVDLGSRPDPRRGEALELLVGAEHKARISDLNIGEAPRIVGGLRAPIERVRRSFGIAFARGRAF